MYIFRLPLDYANVCVVDICWKPIEIGRRGSENQTNYWNRCAGYSAFHFEGDFLSNDLFNQPPALHNAANDGDTWNLTDAYMKNILQNIMSIFISLKTQSPVQIFLGKRKL